MSAEQFANLQEALVFVYGSITGWWLVLLVVMGLAMASFIFALGLARFLLSKKTDYSQGSLF